MIRCSTELLIAHSGKGKMSTAVLCEWGSQMKKVGSTFEPDLWEQVWHSPEASQAGSPLQACFLFQTRNARTMAQGNKKWVTAPYHHLGNTGYFTTTEIINTQKFRQVQTKKLSLPQPRGQNHPVYLTWPIFTVGQTEITLSGNLITLISIDMQKDFRKERIPTDPAASWRKPLHHFFLFLQIPAPPQITSILKCVYHPM